MSSEKFNKGNEHLGRELRFTLESFQKDGKQVSIIFGRSSHESSIVFHDTAVSSKHFALSIFDLGDGPVFMISDLGSTNGTTIEGIFTKELIVLRKGQAVPLPDSSIITFGTQKYQVSLSQTSGPSPEPTLTLLLV